MRELVASVEAGLVGLAARLRGSNVNVSDPAYIAEMAFDFHRHGATIEDVKEVFVRARRERVWFPTPSELLDTLDEVLAARRGREVSTWIVAIDPGTGVEVLAPPDQVKDGVLVPSGGNGVESAPMLPAHSEDAESRLLRGKFFSTVEPIEQVHASGN